MTTAAFVCGAARTTLATNGAVATRSSTCGLMRSTTFAPRMNRSVLPSRKSSVRPLVRMNAAGASSDSVPLPSPKDTKTGFYFALWYFLNVTFNIINKKTLNMWPYPWTLSLVQLGVGALYCTIQWIIGTRKRPNVDWPLIKALFLPSLAHTIGHVTSCLSFSSVAISFTHIVKSAEPVFGATCAAIFLKETYPWYVYFTLIPVISGVALSSATELTFTWLGFSTAMISNLAFALRNVFSKVTMTDKKNDPTLTSENVYGLITIWSFLLELPLAVLADRGVPPMVSRLPDIAFPVLFRYFMTSCLLYHLYNEVSYLALGNVSPVTFSVGNTIKRVIIISTSIIVFKTKILPMNAVGSVIAIIGTFLYSMAKNRAAGKI